MTNKKQTSQAEEKTGAFTRVHDTVTDSAVTDSQKEKITIEDESEEKDENKGKKKSTVETDTETLQTTDPQENMKGPLSSIMQNIKETAEANDAESKEEADKKKDKNI